MAKWTANEELFPPPMPLPRGMLILVQSLKKLPPTPLCVVSAPAPALFFGLFPTMKGHY